MSVTGAVLTDREENLRQVERLIQSNILHGSESLCKLLRYLAEQTIDHAGSQVKEYQIATEVFGRPKHFDPRLDSTVRVQTGRLRSKLSEYYGAAGADDAVVIEIPKGSYSVQFHRRPGILVDVPPVALSPERGLSERSPEEIPHGLVTRTWRTAALVVATLLLAAVAGLLFQASARRGGAPASTPESRTFQAFWKHFVDVPDEPWVVFSNAEFVGRPESGMRYFVSGDPKDKILDHYTGVGEVLAVHELDRVFQTLNHGLRVKRGHLLSLDDAKNNNLIFLGSPSENLTLRDIPGTQEFLFQRSAILAREDDLAIVNIHPRTGEQSMFFASPSMPLSEDYAVIALASGLNQSRWQMILAGTTTIGTQAAVEYVSRASNLDSLLPRIGREVRPFEAVLHVKVRSGVPVDSEIVALHVRTDTKP
ncbi:MAG: hypothetical protein M3O35_11755 [Acidobacteriota bacterium]|nr:hypothetical protein [Acidobacteriota bacterium]